MRALFSGYGTLLRANWPTPLSGTLVIELHPGVQLPIQDVHEALPHTTAWSVIKENGLMCKMHLYIKALSDVPKYSLTPTAPSEEDSVAVGCLSSFDYGAQYRAYTRIIVPSTNDSIGVTLTK